MLLIILKSRLTSKVSLPSVAAISKLAASVILPRLFVKLRELRFLAQSFSLRIVVALGKIVVKFRCVSGRRRTVRSLIKHYRGFLEPRLDIALLCIRLLRLIHAVVRLAVLIWVSTVLVKVLLICSQGVVRREDGLEDLSDHGGLAVHLAHLGHLLFELFLTTCLLTGSLSNDLLQGNRVLKAVLIKFSVSLGIKAGGAAGWSKWV